MVGRTSNLKYQLDQFFHSEFKAHILLPLQGLIKDSKLTHQISYYCSNIFFKVMIVVNSEIGKVETDQKYRLWTSPTLICSTHLFHCYQSSNVMHTEKKPKHDIDIGWCRSNPIFTSNMSKIFYF